MDHTVRHFTDEEALQLEYGYPDYENHRQLHENFKATVNDLARRFNESGSSEELSSDVNKIVLQWLIHHIRNEDKKISEHIRKITTPAQ